MNSTTITEYILKIEKLNEESRIKIEQLKELYRKSEEERVATLEKLNSKLLDESIQRVGAVLNEPSLYETTARTKTHTLNKEIAEHLRELGEMTADFYKAGAYNTAADIIATLDFEVQNGESLLGIKGIGKSIASKVDQFLDEYFDDSESVASNEGQILEESDDETESESETESETDTETESETETETETDTESEFFVSYNHEIVDIFDKLASYEEDPHKRNAYRTIGDALHALPYKVTSGQELAKGPEKVKGIGKSAAKIIDEFLATGKVEKLDKIGSTNEEVARALDDYAEDLEDPFKVRAYKNAADAIRNLDYEVMSGEELAKGPKKVKGIGKSIANRIDKFLQTGEMN
jgi:DNA polymerase/3'-5' exonuclease PolX